MVASYSATDGLSGFVTGATENGAFTFTLEGANQSHSFTVTDLAGNSTSAVVSNVNIDKTAPSINALRNPPPNANGWNNTDVTVDFDGADALSGIASVSGPVTVSTEGANQIVTGTATDLAGNTTSTSVSVSVDKTAPELFIQFDVASKDVQVLGRDGLSGVAAGPILPLPGSPPSYCVTDLAGNTLTIVLKVGRDPHALSVKVISLSYRSGPVSEAAKNHFTFDWKTNGNGSLKTLDQILDINSEPDRQSAAADYNSVSNETTIKVKDTQPIVRPGLVLLKLTTNQGVLGLEY